MILVRKKVPILITFDVDPAPDLQEGMEHALDLLDGNEIPATFFFTARPADKTTVEKVLKAGHEVGCHGLTHSLEEEFNKMDEEIQREILTEATRRLEDISGSAISSFRSPRVKISAVTLRILEELGYLIDSSVCSQRLDLLSSNLINPGWLISPRRPYHPNFNSPYRRGDMRIHEIPVSALVLPFLSTTMRLLGVGFMKRFFDLLYWESRITGKPIVYLVHPFEFVFKETISFQWRMLIPNKLWLIHGFPLRGPLVRRHLGPEVKKMNSELIQYMRSKKDVRFSTMKQYLQNDSIPPR